jgi:IclR family transcriptional regulator, KDG regulon repressor
LAEIQSLARGLKILEAVAQARDGAAITDLAQQLGIDKGSASRLVQTLAQYGYAEKNPRTRRYHLGPKVVALSQALLSRMPLRNEAEPFLRRLVDETNECAHLGILAQGQVLYIHQAESPSVLRVNANVGTQAPLHCTALGKVLLAFGGAPIPQELPSYTPRTITDAKILQMHLQQTRQQGYAVDDEEYDYGVRCLAAPVYALDKVVGAIGISGPSNRMTLEQLPRLSTTVVEVAKVLSDRLSFRHSRSH